MLILPLLLHFLLCFICSLSSEKVFNFIVSYFIFTSYLIVFGIFILLVDFNSKIWRRRLSGCIILAKTSFTLYENQVIPFFPFSFSFIWNLTCRHYKMQYLHLFLLGSLILRHNPICFATRGNSKQPLELSSIKE